uniref:Uncharacterized protein n=1 Tax=Seriola lalandi dorsalis TaxID=1841481 RepID=A0A3B4WJN8_SERLL
MLLGTPDAPYPTFSQSFSLMPSPLPPLSTYPMNGIVPEWFHGIISRKKFYRALIGLYLL